ncbi:hypothetical protein NC652_003770 [Populus alba x Populus x berolinensis]|nr:hypothetical protein NC652_003770 [Populus alba x Populus x berolinensis]
MPFDHYFAVHNWSPKFISSTEKINRVMVWLRILSYNLVFYDESFLMAMASTIGKPVKVDLYTLNVERGHFAHIYIEIYLD